MSIHYALDPGLPSPAGFTATTRLYDFWIDAPVELYVEAFHSRRAHSELYAIEVFCLSPDAISRLTP